MHLASRMNDPRVIKQYHQLSFTSSSDSGIDFHVLTIVPSSIPLYILCIVDQNATSSWKGYFFIWEQRENKEGKIGAHEVGVSSIRCLNCVPERDNGMKVDWSWFFHHLGKGILWMSSYRDNGGHQYSWRPDTIMAIHKHAFRLDIKMERFKSWVHNHDSQFISLMLYSVYISQMKTI